MWSFLPTLVVGVVWVATGAVMRPRRSGASDLLLLSPWQVLLAAAIVPTAAGIVWWRVRTGLASPPAFTVAHAVVVAVVAVLPIAAALLVLWVARRRPFRPDLCIACGHSLRDDQPACPECGAVRASSDRRTLAQRYEAMTAARPVARAALLGGQHGLLLAAMVGGALLVVPTPRRVETTRLSGNTMMRCRGVTLPTGKAECVVRFSTRLLSVAITPASFLGPAPSLRTDITLFMTVDGTIAEERKDGTTGTVLPMAIDAEVRSATDVMAMDGALRALTADLKIPAARDPAAELAEQFLIIAPGYWPMKRPDGTIGPTAMADADRQASTASIEPRWQTFGLPAVAGVVAWVVATARARRREPAAAVS